MFWSIPSNKEQIQLTTPLGAKSIRYLYFENKNGGIFAFKTLPDSISISVDGKQICRNLVMLPFCTGTPDGVRRHNWQDVAIEVPLNIENSEVKISGVRNNDFNIVFVLSDKVVEESNGFDYYESFVLDLKNERTICDDFRATMHTAKIDATSGVEYVLPLEYEPLGVFAWNHQLTTEIVNSDFPSNVGKQFVPPYLVEMSASDNEDMPAKMNLSLLSCTDHIPHTKAYYEFPYQPTRKNVQVAIKTTQEGSGKNIADNTVICSQTILFFKSKQLA